jgi:hypothetical protein
MKNDFGINYRIEIGDNKYETNAILKVLAELPVEKKPALAQSMYDLIYLVAPGITSDQAKDVYKDLPKSTFKRWGFENDYE